MTTMTTIKNNDAIIETSKHRKHDNTRWMTAVIIIGSIWQLGYNERMEYRVFHIRIAYAGTIGIACCAEK